MTFLSDGIDHPTAQQVIDAGAAGVLMYAGTPQYTKNFRPSQYRDYKSRGLQTPFVFEDGANDMAGGQAGGAAHASALLTDLRKGGVSNQEPVGPTVDEHITAANIPLAVAYQRGFYQFVKDSGWQGHVGGYGFSEYLIAIHDNAIADWYWGAGARSAMPPYTNIWQDNTGVIIIGGSKDDKDWILIPLPQSGTGILGGLVAAGDWTGAYPVGMAEATWLKANGWTLSTDGQRVEHTVAVADQGTWMANDIGRTQFIADKLLPDLAAQISVLAAQITTLQAAVVALPAPGQVTDAQMATLTAKLIAAYPNYNISITKA